MNESASVIQAGSLEELRQAVSDHPRVLIVGNQTKPALSKCLGDVQLISTGSLSGVVEYESSEFTFTARAGTTLAEITETLAARQQYLPCDPIGAAEATLAGTLAAGMSGPGRLIYGGVRDFILGVQLLTGDGQVVRAGGKVVKNAAGFDIPKLLVGSCGRLGGIIELTFKVFPRPTEWHTFSVDCATPEKAAEVIGIASRQRWAAHAIDYLPARNSVWIRLCGQAETCRRIGEDIKHCFSSQRFTEVDRQDAAASYADLAIMWPDRAAFVKVPLTLGDLDPLCSWVEKNARGQTHIGVAGSIAWLGLDAPELADLHTWLEQRGLSGLVCRGDLSSLGGCRIGKQPDGRIEHEVQLAMDPPSRFAAWSTEGEQA